MSAEIETQKDIGTDEAARVKRWLQEIQVAGKHEKNWRSRSHKVIKQYRDESREANDSTSEFNILWSNTETLKPSLYSSTPRPDVRRRYRDNDEVGRSVAKLIERGLSFQIDTQDFDMEILSVIEDYLLPGRGVARERYVPTMAMGEPPRIPVQAITTFDEEGNEAGMQFMAEGVEVDPEEVQGDALTGYFKVGDPMEEKVWEVCQTEYVLWENFRQSSEPLWRHKRWVAFGTEMTRDELVSSFGDIGREVTLSQKKSEVDGTDDPPDSEEAQNDTGEFLKTAFVWEIWDREERKVRFVTAGLKDKFLLEQDDPLKLTNFFPCPEPLISVKTNNSSIPIPEFTLYQDLAHELNDITMRISRLIRALKVRGVYDPQFKDALNNLLDGEENELIPMDGFAMLAERGGLEGAVAWMPIEQIGKVLVGLYNQRGQIIQAIYEVTGISDIMRGATDPRETAKAQQLKGQFGSMRLQPRQKAVQRFIRDLFRIKTEIMVEFFDVETLSDMTQMKITPEMLAVMRDDAMRTYKIDVETDSTIAEDEARDKQDVVQLFQGMGEFIGSVGPMVQEGAIPKDAALAMLLWGMRRFRGSREVEEILSNGLEQAKQQPQGGQEQPDPAQQAEAQAIQAEAQRKAQESQARLQMDAQAMQAEQQRKDREAAQKMQLERDEFEREQRRKDALNEAKIQAIQRQEQAREEEMRSQG